MRTLVWDIESSAFVPEKELLIKPFPTEDEYSSILRSLTSHRIAEKGEWSNGVKLTPGQDEIKRPSSPESITLTFDFFIAGIKSYYLCAINGSKINSFLIYDFYTFVALTCVVKLKVEL